MKLHHKIFFLTLVSSVGLFLNCKADTIDNYQIYIGKTLKLTEASFNPLRSTLPLLKLDSSNYAETLNINFSHCTYGASSRQLKLTDTADKAIMIWEFGDKEQKPVMSIPISEILTNTRIKSNSSFSLYYVDKEYPEWRFLTSVRVGQVDLIKEEKKEIKVRSKTFDLRILLYALAILTIIFLAVKLVRQRSPNR